MCGVYKKHSSLVVFTFFKEEFVLVLRGDVALIRDNVEYVVVFTLYDEQAGEDRKSVV